MGRVDHAAETSKSGVDISPEQLCTEILARNISRLTDDPIPQVFWLLLSPSHWSRLDRTIPLPPPSHVIDRRSSCSQEPIMVRERWDRRRLLSMILRLVLLLDRVLRL